MNRRERILATVVVALTALIAAWKLVVSPVMAKASDMRERAAFASAAIDAEEALAARADAIRARDAEMVFVDNLSDVGAAEAAFLEFINEKARAAGLTVASERPSNSVHLSAGKHGPYAEIQVALTGEGTLDALVAFFSAVADGKRPLRVIAASMSRTDKAGVLAINMRLSTAAVTKEAK